MALENTVSIPIDDLNAAEALFISTLANDKISIIIFGDTEKSKLAITLADNLANAVTSGFHRQVIWVKDPSQWNTLRTHLRNGTLSVHDIDPRESIGVSITLSNKTEYALDISKTPDNLTLTLVFLNASKA
ncbi:MAG: hypothetical protein ACJAS3_000143 [Roseivirga sp.]|jgi:hypothetical protein